VFCRPDSGFSRECEEQNLACGNVANAIRLGKLVDCEPSIRENDGGLGPRATELRALTGDTYSFAG